MAAIVSSGIPSASMAKKPFPRPKATSNKEAQIRTQAARALADVFDSLYEGAFAVDKDARIVWMNDKFKALLGWNGLEPAEGKPVEEVMPDSQMRNVVETGQPALLDIFPLGKQQVVVSRIPLKKSDGTITGGLGVILFDRIQALRPLINKFQDLQTDLADARQQLAKERRAKYSFTNYVGNSPAVRELKRQARRAAERDSTVLLLGETGTGKELLAHAIHAASPRAHKAMVRVNVAAIPEALLEAELFGTVPGAFTGADRKGRDGKFQVADQGTLFLDEVGDMPQPIQVKLLRVLQEKEVEPLGSNRVRTVDVRVIAATSRDLKAMVDDGSFRADLYYRLNVLPLSLPPLRQHKEDLAFLCETLLEGVAANLGDAPSEVTPEGVARLAEYDWPGNVRELGNVLEQAATRGDQAILDADDFADILPTADSKPLETTSVPTDVMPLREAVANAEKIAINAALKATNGNKSKAAKMLGISRAQFYEKMATLSEIPDT